MKNYVKIHVWDFIFTFVISLGLALNVFSSFVISTPLVVNNFVIIPSVVAVNLILFAFGYNKKTAIAGTVIGLIGLIVAVVFLRSTTGGDVALFWTILVFSTVGTYLFTRVQKLVVPFALGALVVCAAFRFLEYPVSTPGFIAMLVGLVLEILYKVYYSSLLKASYGTFNIKKFMLQSTAITLVVMALSSSVYFFVVQPMNPKTRDLKLITKLLSWDVMETVGISSKTEVPLNDLTSSNVNDNKNNTSNKNENPDDKDTDEKDTPPEDDKEEQEKNNDLLNKTKDTLQALSVRYEYKDYYLYIIIAVAVLIIALPFVIKYWIRRRFFNKISALPDDQKVKVLYGKFLKSFKKLGIGKADNVTVLEYSKSMSGELNKFSTEDGISFNNLTEIFNKTLYGYYEPQNEDSAKFESFQKAFYKNAKEYVGTPKYCLKFWVL